MTVFSMEFINKFIEFLKNDIHYNAVIYKNIPSFNELKLIKKYLVNNIFIVKKKFASYILSFTTL